MQGNNALSINNWNGGVSMKYIVKGLNSKLVLGYCYGCGSQCQNKATEQCVYYRQ